MKPNILLAAAIAVPLLVSLGCTQEPSDPPRALTPASPPTAKAPADPASPTTRIPVAANPPAPAPGAQTQVPDPTTGISSQTPPATAQSEPAENEPLQQAAKQLASALFEAVSAGAPSGMTALTVTDDERATVLADGYRRILGPTLKQQNEAVLSQLGKSLAGRTVTDYGYRPGKLTETPTQGSFAAAVPHMQDAAVTLRVDGVYVEIGLDQLVYLNGNWKILEMSLP